MLGLGAMKKKPNLTNDPVDPQLAVEGSQRLAGAPQFVQAERLEAWLGSILRRKLQASHAAGYRTGISKGVYVGKIVDIVAHAMEVFGNRTKALRWLRTPIPSLDNETPEDMLKREGGIERVQDVLGRIEHGVW